MYSYIIGEIGLVKPTGITIENNNIGYFVNVSNPYAYTVGITVKLYIEQIVREDSNNLYGFLSEDEKELFLDLISVKGIGPKSALAILGAGSIIEIKQSICSNDIVYLQRFPKIGKKSASQIVLDLSSKYENFTAINSQESNNDDEVVEALASLGYNSKEINKYLKGLDNGLTVEEKIKEILIAMTMK